MTRLAVVVLLTLGMFGMLFARGPHIERALPAGLTLLGTLTVTHAWLPIPQPGLSRALAPGEHWKAPPVSAIHALTAVAAEREYDAIRIGFCESGWDAGARIIDVDGLPREGAFMVGATWWGAVPATLYEQAAQFDRIVREHGTAPFTTAGGCDRWRE